MVTVALTRSSVVWDFDRCGTQKQTASCCPFGRSTDAYTRASMMRGTSSNNTVQYPVVAWTAITLRRLPFHLC